MSDHGPNPRSRVALVTGATGGIGSAVALRLAQNGFRVIGVGRDRRRGEGVLDQLRDVRPVERRYASDHLFLRADLSLMSETAALAGEVATHTDRLDALVCCAGNFALRPEWTSEGLERAFALNYLSRFVLIAHLMPMLLQAASGRVVLVANAGRYRDTLDLEDLNYHHGRRGLRVSARTQLANDLLAVELADRHRATPLEVSCVFPGVVRTNLFRNAVGVPGPLSHLLAVLAARTGLPPEVAADTPAWLAASPETRHLSGSFYGPRRSRRQVPAAARRQERRQALWRATEDLVSRWLPATISP
jgi:NAD(P)-dependent dehydrogenase (short-subunit alcohol dehydrogenase family)